MSLKSKLIWGIIVLVMALAMVIYLLPQETPPVAVEAVDPVPTDTSEWVINLPAPVLPVYQEVQTHFLPDMVYEIFRTEHLEQISSSGTEIAKVNNLPVDPCNYGLTAYFIYFPMREDEGLNWQGKWSHQTDPKEYFYVIEYKSQLIGLWFDSPSLLHCKKIKTPDGDYPRPEAIDLPKFDQPVEWSWYFTGASYDCSAYAMGKVIDYSAQNGYTEALTLWKGGGHYKLPPANTRIEVGGKVIYCE